MTKPSPPPPSPSEGDEDLVWRDLSYPCADPCQIHGCRQITLVSVAPTAEAARTSQGSGAPTRPNSRDSRSWLLPARGHPLAEPRESAFVGSSDFRLYERNFGIQTHPAGRAATCPFVAAEAGTLGQLPVLVSSTVRLQWAAPTTPNSNTCHRRCYREALQTRPEPTASRSDWPSIDRVICRVFDTSGSVHPNPATLGLSGRFPCAPESEDGMGVGEARFRRPVDIRSRIRRKGESKWFFQAC